MSKMACLSAGRRVQVEGEVLIMLTNHLVFVTGTRNYAMHSRALVSFLRLFLCVWPWKRTLSYQDLGEDGQKGG